MTTFPITAYTKDQQKSNTITNLVKFIIRL